MDEMLLSLFRLEVETQCEYVLLGAVQLATAHGLLKEPGTHGIPPTYFALQNILAACANLSKLFWGNSPERAQNRTELRETIGVTDDSPLRDRALRNHFEHIDERLEAWYERPDRGGYAGYSIRSPGPGFDIFGAYDPATGVVQFWDHTVSIPMLISEARRVLANAQQAERDYWDNMMGGGQAQDEPGG